MFTNQQRQFISQESSFRRKEESSSAEKAAIISHRNHQLMVMMASAPPSEWDHLTPQAPPPSAPPPPPPPVVTATPVYDSNVQYSNHTTCTTSHYQNNNSYPAITGQNKKLRDRAKYILAATCVLLFLDQNGWALVCSVLALFTLKQGTLFSHKNWKWLFLSAVSVAVSAAGYLWNRSEKTVDARRAYHMKMGLWIVAHWLSGCWAIVLGLFLVSALVRPEQLEHWVERAAERVPAVRATAATPPPAAVMGLAPAVPLPEWSYHHQKQQ